MPNSFAWSALVAALALLLVYPTLPAKDAYILCSPPGNRSIHTVDAYNTILECIFVQNSRIIATGSLDEVQREWHSSSKTFPFRVNVAVKHLPPHSVVIPGLSDSHAHILEYGKNAQLPLEEAGSANETVALVRQYILSRKDLYNDRSKIILGGGWDHASWPSGGFPTAADLDADPVIRGRSVVLQSKDCHALWLSTAALDHCGDPAALPHFIEGGVILRDQAGYPTGVLLDNAQGYIKLPEPTEVELQERFYAAVKDALSYGLTSIHDAGLDPISLDFFERSVDCLSA
ncbi:hypothetical protein VNI00_010297 [Paramarasmius palmivorus]|uniref:Amidohydrolase 3 domain-containing protein n=1 Tax=Paramarasmius palmivorus TaxID=297713 RepID=A0AAW0CJL9_9AGAR